MGKTEAMYMNHVGLQILQQTAKRSRARETHRAVWNEEMEVDAGVMDPIRYMTSLDDGYTESRLRDSGS